MRPIDESLLTPNERRAAVASILADGVLRLCVRTLPTAEVSGHLSPENLAESASSCLEVPAETVLSVHNG